MNPLAIPMSSPKKLNTYGVESPCEYSPGVGSFLANPGAIKNTTRTELRDETILGVAWLIIKRKTVCAISLCKIRQNMRPFDANYPLK